MILCIIDLSKSQDKFLVHWWLDGPWAWFDVELNAWLGLTKCFCSLLFTMILKKGGTNPLQLIHGLIFNWKAS